MMSPAPALRAVAVACLVLLAGAGCLAADWLVTHDGQKIETRGPWKVKGKMVVFTLPNGTFSSLRLDTVDLEASRGVEKVAQEEALSAARLETEKEKKQPVLVLTDADVSRRRPAFDDSPDLAGADEEGDEEAEVEATSGKTISIGSWQKVEAIGGGFDIAGSFGNESEKMATDVTLTVLLYDAEGNIVDAVAAELTTASLGPGERGQFTASFETEREFAAMKFDVSSFDLGQQ